MTKILNKQQLFLTLKQHVARTQITSVSYQGGGGRDFFTKNHEYKCTKIYSFRHVDKQKLYVIIIKVLAYTQHLQYFI